MSSTNRVGKTMSLGGTVKSSVLDMFMEMPVRNPVECMSVDSGSELSVNYQCEGEI